MHMKVGKVLSRGHGFSFVKLYQSQQEEESSSKTQVTIFCNLITEVASSQSQCILFVSI